MKIFSNGTDDWFPSEGGDSNGLSGKLVGFEVSSIPGGGGGSGSLSNGLNVGAGGGGGGGGRSGSGVLPNPKVQSDEDFVRQRDRVISRLREVNRQLTAFPGDGILLREKDRLMGILDEYGKLENEAISEKRAELEGRLKKVRDALEKDTGNKLLRAEQEKIIRYIKIVR